ncbi:sugar transferase [Ramlibacter solisilvae]|uniref:Uncharacterized protein n=2 Tax=Ramlibacter tataouinensis TaxID=94132 RepID=A0A127JSA5_9BURK|nr:hypothetical protein UC35_07965 [Ramlibacter tataouinensis]
MAHAWQLPERSSGAPAPAGIFLTTALPDESTAWSKARRDVGGLLGRLGYASLPLPSTWRWREWLRLGDTAQAMLPSGGHVLIEYPFAQRKRSFLLRLLCRRRGLKLYGLIHDLDSLRNADSSVKREVAILKTFDGLISHSPAMTRWLREQGVAAPIAELELFDYCAAPGPAWHEGGLDTPLKVACAGNLAPAKAGFVYDPRLAQLPGVELSLYGPYFEPERMRSPLNCLGVFDPDQPALQARCHFGLVWDGDDVDSCDGISGRYMRYNIPHKVSLYLALGLPVVVWREAAAASFVQAHRIGLTVGSLRELGAIPARLSSPEYLEMAANAMALGREVRRGAFLHRALQALAGA